MQSRKVKEYNFNTRAFIITVRVNWIAVRVVSMTLLTLGLAALFSNKNRPFILGVMVLITLCVIGYCFLPDTGSAPARNSIPKKKRKKPAAQARAEVPDDIENIPMKQVASSASASSPPPAPANPEPQNPAQEAPAENPNYKDVFNNLGSLDDLF